MTRQKLTPPNESLAKIRDILQSIEPRKMPTETRRNNWGHDCWVCPYCSELVRRKDRYVLRGHKNYKRQERLVDYSSYNMHFAHAHGEPFWKEKQILKLIEKEKRK